MSDRRDPIEEWRDLSGRAARATGYRPRQRSGVVAGHQSGLGLGAAVAAVAIVVAGLALRPASVANPPSASPDGPVVASTDDGTFRLELSTPHVTYGPTDAIEPVATLTYIGPGTSIGMFHADPAISFGIEEVGGGRTMSGIVHDICMSTELSKAEPLVVPFRKSGAIPASSQLPGTSGAATGFDEPWFRDPVLWLPTGSWRIVARLDVDITDGTRTCGGQRHQLSVENVIRVVDPGTSTAAPSPSVSPSPSATPLSADAAAALDAATRYETARAADQSDAAWRLLSPWSRTTVGSFATFADAERRLNAAGYATFEVTDPSQDPDLLDPAFLGARATDLHVTADRSRTFLVPVRYPGIDAASAGTTNLVVAPVGDAWRIWLDTAPGAFGAFPFPDGCPAYGVSTRRCTAMVDLAREELALDPGQVTATWLMPEPGCGGDPLAEGIVLCTRSMGYAGGVRFDLADGTSKRQDLFCGVGPPSLICTETPGIQAADLHGGYWDVPCAGEAPDGCASPVPFPTGPAAEAGRELRIGALAVPVGPIGHREVEIGTAVLVNGIVREARLTLADQVQDGFLLDPGVVRLELRSTIAGRPPFDNIYARGTFDGPETVRVLLVFDVAETSPDATIQVTSVEVR